MVRTLVDVKTCNVNYAKIADVAQQFIFIAKAVKGIHTICLECNYSICIA